MNQDYSGRSPASGMGMSVNEAREAATRSSGEVSGRRAPRIDDPGVAMRELPEQMICLEDSVGALYSALEDFIIKLQPVICDISHTVKSTGGAVTPQPMRLSSMGVRLQLMQNRIDEMRHAVEATNSRCAV